MRNLIIFFLGVISLNCFAIDSGYVKKNILKIQILPTSIHKMNQYKFGFGYERYLVNKTSFIFEFKTNKYIENFGVNSSSLYYWRQNHLLRSGVKFYFRGKKRKAFEGFYLSPNAVYYKIHQELSLYNKRTMYAIGLGFGYERVIKKRFVIEIDYLPFYSPRVKMESVYPNQDYLVKYRGAFAYTRGLRIGYVF